PVGAVEKIGFTAALARLPPAPAGGHDDVDILVDSVAGDGRIDRSGMAVGVFGIPAVKSGLHSHIALVGCSAIVAGPMPHEIIGVDLIEDPYQLGSTGLEPVEDTRRNGCRISLTLAAELEPAGQARTGGEEIGL